MKRVIAVVLVTIVACACPKKGGGRAGTGSAEGSGSNAVAPAQGTCEGVKAKIESLYRAEAQAKEPKRVEEAVADNTAMAMAECTKAPDRVAPCIAQAASLKDIEAICMPQLDDEGTEGDTLKPR